MLIEITKEEFRRLFDTAPTPYLREDFLELVEHKTEKVIRLVNSDDTSVGVLLGVSSGMLRSPFSAPFGGFHYRHEHMFYHIFTDFLEGLKDYVVQSGYKSVSITLPPDIYQKNFNAKCVRAFLQLGFTMQAPDLTNWVKLDDFEGNWTKGAVAQNCRKAMKYHLTCVMGSTRSSMETAYNVIHNNRAEQGRNIYMELDDILQVQKLFPIDFFMVQQPDGETLGAAICYRGHPKIIQVIFMGDNLEKRNWGIMDYLYMSMYDFYKSKGYKYLDLGLSSLNGEPNTGLLRFKEIHNCDTSLRYTFSWSSQ